MFLSKYVSVRSAAAGRKGEGTELAGSAGSLCLTLSPFKPIKPINPKGPKLTDPDDVFPIASTHKANETRGQS